MIESYYWKQDLLKHARRLRPVEKPRRWSEKYHVAFEKEIILSFFCIRKLFETNKVSSKSRKYRAQIFCCYPSGKRITNLNHYDIDDVYDLSIEFSVSKSILFIANQAIHSCTLFAYRNEDRNWGGIYVCSDFERDKTIYRIPIDELIKIFRLVAKDYPSSMNYQWDDSLGDYKISTD
jgi:hypothetical protein